MENVEGKVDYFVLKSMLGREIPWAPSWAVYFNFRDAPPASFSDQAWGGREARVLRNISVLSKGIHQGYINSFFSQKLPHLFPPSVSSLTPLNKHLLPNEIQDKIL